MENRDPSKKFNWQCIFFYGNIILGNQGTHSDPSGQLSKNLKKIHGKLFLNQLNVTNIVKPVQHVFLTFKKMWVFLYLAFYMNENLPK